MISAKPLPDENERLAELLRYEVLDSPAEKDFNSIVELASHVCETEISLVSLIDEKRQWFKASKGLDTQETHRDLAFCAHAIHGDDIFEIADASQDERFHDNPLVESTPNIRFYAGQPIKSSGGKNLGTLCVISTSPRMLTEFQRYVLKVLGRQVEQLLELRLKVSQLEKGYEQIKEQQQSLTKLNKLKDQTLSLLSHDLRSPLANIVSILDMFNQDYLAVEELKDLIGEIQAEVSQQVDQLDRVLEWAQEEIQNGETQCRYVALKPIIAQSLDWVRKDAKNKGVNLSEDIEEDLAVLGDQDLLEIVLRNLLKNAVKYTSEGDKICLFAHLEGDFVQLKVSDTGLGIHKDNLDKVLDNNSSFSTLGTARENGTGLGLLFCQNYLQKMNSKLEVHSHWQQGCTFSFLLPKAVKSKV